MMFLMLVVKVYVLFIIGMIVTWGFLVFAGKVAKAFQEEYSWTQLGFMGVMILLSLLIAIATWCGV